MKKALIVLLILAVAGGAFAQSWSGSVNTGAKITFTDDDIPIMATRNSDDDAAVDASLSFTNEDDTWGITVGASANVGTDASVNGLDIGDMYGWVKFADIFKLTAGKGIGGAWGSGGNTDTSLDDGNAAGVRLEIEPIDGLNFGARFRYPNNGVKANKIANFFQETGIGAKYDGGAWWLALGLDLNSEETTGDGLDGLFYFGFNFTGLDLVKIHVGTKIENVFTDQTVTLFEQLNGTIVGLNWYVKANEKVTPDPLTIEFSAGVDYGIDISDKASVTLYADAGSDYADELGDVWWDVGATFKYNFNDNVWTSAQFEVGGGDVYAWLRWLVGFSF